VLSRPSTRYSPIFDPCCRLCISRTLGGRPLAY
jgi:hypothetical protein